MFSIVAKTQQLKTYMFSSEPLTINIEPGGRRVNITVKNCIGIGFGIWGGQEKQQYMFVSIFINYKVDAATSEHTKSTPTVGSMLGAYIKKLICLFADHGLSTSSLACEHYNSKLYWNRMWNLRWFEGANIYDLFMEHNCNLKTI